MGLPAVCIPEQMLPNLVRILSEAGMAASVASKSADDPRGQVVTLVCEPSKDEKVWVDVRRLPDMIPEGLLVILCPATWESRRLLKPIEDVLRQHGATDLPPFPNTSG